MACGYNMKENKLINDIEGEILEWHKNFINSQIDIEINLEKFFQEN